MNSTELTTPLAEADQGEPSSFMEAFALANRIKPATTYEEQVQKMKDRGLIIKDEDFVIEVLQRVNYYRFTGYLLPFKLDTDDYCPGTSFEKIYSIYQFDQRLRNMLIRQLEYIEISMRAKFSYHLAHKYEPLGYENLANFRELSREGVLLHTGLISRLQNEFTRAVNKGQLFATHHHREYGGQLPIWVAVELMSFGDISTLYTIMLQKDQESISQTYFSLKPDYLESWLKSLRYIRNACAHYERLYDLDLVVSPKLHRKEKVFFSNKKIFSSIFVCCRLLDSAAMRDDFLHNLSALVEKYKEVIDFDIAGFPEAWDEILERIRLPHA